MIKPIPERITYAQQKLINLIENRQLRKWCMENNLSHPIIYNIAMGSTAPTYRSISELSYLIPVVDWFYFTDEKIPYDRVVIPKWNYKDHAKCKFVSEHRFDYKSIAKKYDLDEMAAYKIFVSYAQKPPVTFIRRCCQDFDPLVFFTEGTVQLEKNYVPCKGDLVNIKENILLVLTSKEENEKSGYFTGVSIQHNVQSDIKLDGTITDGFVNIHSVQSFVYKNNGISKIESVNKEFLKTVLKEVKALFSLS